MGTSEQVPATVTVLIRRQGDGFYAYSPDVLGLRIYGASEHEVCERIVRGIELLYKLNHGKIVHATLAADKETLTRAPIRTSNSFLIAEERKAA